MVGANIASGPAARMKPRSPVVALMLVLSTLCVAFAIWQAISPFVPHLFPGVGFYGNGRVNAVYPGSPAAREHVSVGDSVIERPNGDAVLGYRLLLVPLPGDTIHVVTAHGTVALRAYTSLYPRVDALSELIRQAIGTVLIVCAALLFARRPGVMAFAFWLWAVSELNGVDVVYALAWLPRQLGLAISLLFSGLNYSGLALVSFALRFPSGSVPPRWRWLDRAAWAALGASAVAEVAENILYFAGRLTDPGFWTGDYLLRALPLLVAAGILLWRQAHSQPLERPRIVWASTAFVAAAVVQAIATVLAAYDVNIASNLEAYANPVRLIIAISNLLPLLAVYPILRYRVFDLGFVVNRAALYSTLTLAAFGTLATVNWLAQHFVTERLAFIMQPVAAIAIGLGYFRVRGWIQGAIERVLFRERFAAEEDLEATIRGLPFVERAESVDEVLVSEVATTLRLGSAALFRLGDHGFERGPSVGWNDEMLDHFPRDDMLARRVLADGPTVRLSSLRWDPGALPASPNDPVVALGVVRRGVLSAIVFYSRHKNGTELEPDELRLMRSVGAAAAVAYETAEVATLREYVRRLEDRNRQLEAGAAPAY